MSTPFSPFLHLAPYHILAYGTLLGAEIFQTFVETGVAFRALPMHMLTTLQKRMFPAYFRLQTALALATILTHPAASLGSQTRRWPEWVPLVVTLVAAVLNMAVYGPRTQVAMMDRIHQETRDGRKYNDPAGRSDEMTRVHRRFYKVHGMSIHVNLVAVICTVWYGFVLSSHLKF